MVLTLYHGGNTLSCPCRLQDGTRLQKEVFDFSPAAEGLPVKQINLLLCGGVGAGKSSIVSTVDSLCQGRISRQAPHGQGTGSLTRQLRKFEFINPDSKKKVRWQLWDSMGWGASDYNKGELGFILDGNLPNKTKLDASISLKTAGFNAEPSIGDAVHCMCLVVPWMQPLMSHTWLALGRCGNLLAKGVSNGACTDMWFL